MNIVSKSKSKSKSNRKINCVGTIPKKFDEIEICMICQECDVECETICKHNFCYECLQSWIHKSFPSRQYCPYCRADIGNDVFGFDIVSNKAMQTSNMT
jgi:hypothetical protein